MTDPELFPIVATMNVYLHCCERTIQKGDVLMARLSAKTGGGTEIYEIVYPYHRCKTRLIHSTVLFRRLTALEALANYDAI